VGLADHERGEAVRVPRLGLSRRERGLEGQRIVIHSGAHKMVVAEHALTWRQLQFKRSRLTSR
jgi:hypothetical protein